MLFRYIVLGLLMSGTMSRIAVAGSLDVTSKFIFLALEERVESVLYDDEINSFVIDGVEVERHNLDPTMRSLSRVQMRKLIAADCYFLVRQDSDLAYHVSGSLRMRGGVYGDDMDDSDYQVTVKQHGKVGAKYALPAAGGCLTTVTNSAVQGNVKSVADGAAKCVGGAAAAIVGKTFLDASNGNQKK